MPNLLNFEWEKDRDGYHIETIKSADTNWVRGPGGWSIRERIEDPRPVGQPFGSALTPSPLSRTDMDLSGLKDWVQIYPDVVQHFLVPDGWATIRYLPLDEHSGLFREFAEVEISSEARAFVGKYGLLHTCDDIEPLEHFFDENNRMRSAVEMWEKGQEHGDWNPLIQAFDQYTRGAASIKFCRAYGAESPTLHITPDSLISAIWFQFAQAVSANTKLYRCAVCPTWFAFGPGTGRRKSARYCSDRCRKVDHRATKEKKT